MTGRRPKISVPWEKKLKPERINTPADLEDHARSRMAGFLDCLRFLATKGIPDQKYVDYLVEKTGEEPAPLVDWMRERLRGLL